MTLVEAYYTGEWDEWAFQMIDLLAVACIATSGLLVAGGVVAEALGTGIMLALAPAVGFVCGLALMALVNNAFDAWHRRQDRRDAEVRQL